MPERYQAVCEECDTDNATKTTDRIVCSPEPRPNESRARIDRDVHNGSRHDGDTVAEVETVEPRTTRDRGMADD